MSRRSPRDCTFPHCGREYVARGYCRGHYTQLVGDRELKPLLPKRQKQNVGDDQRRCSCCQVIQPFKEFHASKSRPDKMGSYCRTCNATKEWFNNLRKHGIDADVYEQRLAAQGGVCAICRTSKPGDRKSRFSIDHDHACCPGVFSCGGCIRGLLCNTCNRAIGLLKDNVSVLKSATRYLSA